MENAPLVSAAASPRTTRSMRTGLALCAALAAVLLTAGATCTYASTADGTAVGNPVVALAAAVAAKPELQLRMTSPYERKLGVKIGDGRYPFPNLVEAHQETRLELLLGNELVFAEHAVWNLDAAPEVNHTGNPVHFTFTALGRTMVHGLSFAASNPVTQSFEVTVKYVRRELRDLSETDRRAYFDALGTIYTVTQEEGGALYGADYRSAAWLVREHLEGAASKSCDHWHDDAGFVNHHVGITIQMERSIQAVDSRVCSHYWDYTIDAIADYDYAQSIIFDDDWFGSSSPSGDKHVVDRGRWAFTPVLQHAHGFSNVTNPYGLLRSPWNTNPVPYVMRSRNTVGVNDAKYTMPGCSSWQAAFDRDTSLADVIEELNGDLHGMIHIMLGGHWFVNQTFIDAINNHKDAMNYSPHISDQLLLASKFLWRQGFVRCPETCGEDTPMSECVCSCPSEIIGHRTSGEVLHASGLLEILPQISTVFVEAMGISEDTVLDVLCHVGHPGEMFTSAAPQDPIFWPLHGLSERFLQLLRLLKSEGEVSLDETWGYEHAHMVLSDTHTVCDWSDVTGMGMPTCTRNQTCSGHKIDDVLPFKNVLPGRTYWTNRQFYHAIAPWSEELPYVFDRLTSWPGCPNATLM